MKRFYVALALICLCAATSIVTDAYLNRLERKMMLHLDAAESSYHSNSGLASADIEKAHKIWKSHLPYLSIFINSETLDDISLGFLEAIAATNAEKSDFNASIYSLKFKLTDLIKTENLSWMSFV